MNPTQSNPFSYGKPVRQPELFFGRQEELRRILNRLLSNVHDSTSLVGERRMGKTSILTYLSNPVVASEFGLTADRYCVIFIDFQGLTDITPERFWKRILSQMAKQICLTELVATIEANEKKRNLDLFDLQDLCDTISSQGLTVVLLLDEFEYITQNPNFGPDFFGTLRSLAIHNNLPLVTSTRRDLVDLCHSDEIKGSPFFNIFSNVVLRPFSRVEVEQMLDQYTAKTSWAFTASDKDLVYKLAGGFPFFVQIAGFFLFEYKSLNLSTPSALIYTSQHFLAEADAHFSSLWKVCSDSQKTTLLILLALDRKKPSPKTITTLDNLCKLNPRSKVNTPELIKRGLVIEEPGSPSVYHLLSEGFAHWIGQEIAASGEEGEPEELKNWLDSRESKDIASAKGILPNFKKKYWPLIATVFKELSFEVAANFAFDFIKMLF